MKILWILLFLIQPMKVNARAEWRLITLTLGPILLHTSDFIFIKVHCDYFSQWIGGVLWDVQRIVGWLKRGVGIPGMNCWLKSGADIPGTDTTIMFVVWMCFAIEFEALRLLHTKLSKKWHWEWIVSYKYHEGDLIQSETQFISDAFYW